MFISGYLTNGLIHTNTHTQKALNCLGSTLIFTESKFNTYRLQHFFSSFKFHLMPLNAMCYLAFNPPRIEKEEKKNGICIFGVEKKNSNEMPIAIIRRKKNYSLNQWNGWIDNLRWKGIDEIMHIEMKLWMLQLDLRIQHSILPTWYV